MLPIAVQYLLWWPAGRTEWNSARFTSLRLRIGHHLQGQQRTNSRDRSPKRMVQGERNYGQRKEVEDSSSHLRPNRLC